ncbi:MAG TPA: pitrilysin family protein, partial [Candidatus Polarisedimenticolaceae bacterium]|nr:pitrilysin family protein [Candidatus Polarisedimenticolaceae bacterium]
MSASSNQPLQPQQDELANGLQVVTAHMPGAYSATIAVFIRVGARYEQFARNGGVSHFLEHLLFKGTTNRPSTRIISEQIDAVGGWNNAYTSHELTNYYVKVPYQHVALGLDILADMVRNSLLDPAEVDRERGVVIEEMNVYRDDPASYVHRLTPPLLWPGHPLEHEVLGDEAVIGSISRDSIASYLKHHYQPQSMVVAAVGRVDHDKVLKQVEALFGDMKPRKPDQPLKVTATLGGERFKVHHKDTAQAHIVISTVAYPYRQANDPAAKLITAILGRGLSSRLFLNVRERKGLAYSVHAAIDNFVDTGEFEVYAGVSIPKQAEAIAAIMEELNRISTQKVGEEELNKAKNQIRGGLQMAMESNSAVADRFGTQQVLLGSIRGVDEIMADIDGVTPDDIRRVAADMLAPERLRLGIISPEPEAAVAA